MNADTAALLKDALGTLQELNPLASSIRDAHSNIESYESTGCVVLDAMLSGELVGGGFPEGRVSILAAESATGKTYITLRTAALAQKKGKVVVIFDSEGAIDASVCRNVGLDIDNVLYYPVKSIEDCGIAVFKVLDNVIKKRLYNKFFVVIDSLGNMPSEIQWERLEKESRAKDMSRAKSMNDFMMQLCCLSITSKTTVICTNHVYDNPTQMYPSLEKNQSGGKKARYIPSAVVQLTSKVIKSDDQDVKPNEAAAIGGKDAVGITISALCTKSRICRPRIEATLFLSWRKGLSKWYGVLHLAEKFGVITSRAGRIYKGDELIGTKRELMLDKEFLKTLLPELQTKIDSEWKYTAIEEDNDDDEDDDIAAQEHA